MKLTASPRTHRCCSTGYGTDLSTSKLTQVHWFHYAGTVIDNHVGYKKDNWYIQAGPAIVAPDGGDSDLEFSGKVGGSSLSEKLSAYGEVSL